MNQRNLRGREKSETGEEAWKEEGSQEGKKADMP